MIIRTTALKSLIIRSKGGLNKVWMCVGLGLIISFIDIMAQGNLLITPRRVVFEGATRSKDLTLSNTGQDTATFDISFKQFRMTENGSFEEISVPDSGQFFADKNVRYFPRSVKLGPGEVQTVKMQLTKTDQLKPGEYRSHAYFRAVPKATALGDEGPRGDSSGIAIKLVPIFGITIPVIIKVGTPSTSITLSDLSIEHQNDSVSKLLVTINRSGNMSVYGDLTAYYSGANGKEIEVGTVKGLAVYTPNVVRKFQLTLKKSDQINYNAGKIRIEYTSQPDTKKEKFGEAQMVLR